MPVPGDADVARGVGTVARGVAKRVVKRVVKHNTRVAQLAGKALNKPWADQFVKAGYKYVFTEVSIAGRELVRPGGFAGETPKPMEWRLTKQMPRSDVVFGNSLNDLSWFDSKAERTSSFTSAQRLSYPKINKNGGVIRWDKPDLPVNLVDGKPVDLNNRAILPERGHIGYADDLSAVSSRQRDLPSLLEQRRGALKPSPTPYLELEDSRLVTDRKLITKKPGAAGSSSDAPKAQPEPGAKPVTASDRAPTSAITKDAGAVADTAIADTRAAAALNADKAIGSRLVESRRFVDDERRYARREAIGDLQLESLEAQAKRDAKLAEKAKKELKKADKAVATAKKDLDAAKLAKTKLKREAALAEKQKAAADLRIAADEAEATAKKSDDTRKLAKKLKQSDTAARKSAEATKRLEAAQKLEASRAARVKPATSAVSKEVGATVDAAVADAAVADTRAAATASADKAIGTRLTENRLGAPVARDVLARAGSHEIVDAAAKVAAKTTRARALLEFAGKGLRLTAKVGRVAFVILDLANPIFDILLAVELVDALVAWLRRDKIREQEEWLRLNDFLVGEEFRTVSPYGIVYLTSIRPMVNSFLEVKLADDSYKRSFLYWLAQWNRTPRTFSGFVYGQIDIDMERQEASSSGPYGVKYDADGEETKSSGRYSVKYYADAPHISFTDAPQPNKRVVTSSIDWVGPQDERNRISEGRKPPYTDPKFNISVGISFQSVRYTPPQPTLTPFDFIIVKCRYLVAEIVTFLSRYDPAILDGMEIRTEIIDPGHIFRGEKIYWLEGDVLPAPVQSGEIHFCLKTVFWVIDKLETNALREGDYSRKDRADRFNAGYYRRLAILRLVTSAHGDLKDSARYAVRPMLNVAGHLRKVVTKFDQQAVEDIEYLMDLATSIDDDLRQTLKECQSSPSSLEYNYQGKAPT